MTETYKKGDREFPKAYRFIYAYLKKTKDGRSYIKGKVEEDTTLKKGDVITIFPAKIRAKESSPQYYGFHQAPEDPNPIKAPEDTPEPEDSADDF